MSIERYVLKTPLDFEKKIKEIAEICGESGREIIAVIRLRDILTYVSVKRAITQNNKEIKISYSLSGRDFNGNHSNGPYFVELDRMKLKKPY